ncbi:hypothetical protein [Pseudoalteromonas sp. Ld20]|uniref:hypothetical protein n=1 Tax=Pseudoalteromonas sp. Ld20 TaxID=649165 RepID=UPI00386361D6
MLVPTVIPSAITAISNLAIQLGPMIAKYAPTVIKVAGDNLPRLVKVLEVISIASDVLMPNEKADELGAKAIAADKTPEDFDQINAYIEYLRNDVKVDEATLSQDPIDVLVRQSVGAVVLLKGLNKELGSDVSLPFVNKLSELGIGGKVVLEIIKTYLGSELNQDEIKAYIDGELTLDKTKQHSDNLLTAYQTANPSMTQQEAEQAVMKDF